MRTRALAIAIAVAAAVAAVAAQNVDAPVVPLVGHWESGVDGGEPIVTADARKWDGKSGPDLPALGRRLFTSPSDVFASNLAPSTAFPVAVVPALDSFTGGTLRVRFKLIAGQSDQTAGLVFGLKPTGDFHYVRYNTKDGNLAVWEFTKGERKVLQHGAHHAQLPLDAWHELTVRVTGARVTGEMKGGFSVEHQLPAPVSGYVGLWAKRDAVTSFSIPQVRP